MVVPPATRLCWVTDCSGLGGSGVSPFLAASGFGVSTAGFSSPRASEPTRTPNPATTVMTVRLILKPPCRNVPRTLPPRPHRGSTATPLLWPETDEPPELPAIVHPPLPHLHPHPPHIRFGLHRIALEADQFAHLA